MQIEFDTHTSYELDLKSAFFQLENIHLHLMESQGIHQKTRPIFENWKTEHCIIDNQLFSGGQTCKWICQ